MQRYGLPLATVQAKFVHGCLYMRPLAVGEKPGSHTQGTAAGVRDEADRPLAPRTPPTRQDRRAGVRRTELASGGRPMVRARPVGTAGEEPCVAGCRAGRPRRRRTGGAHRRRAGALRRFGTQEPGDARRRPGAHRRSAGPLREVGYQRQRGGRAAHRQFTGDGRDGGDAAPRWPAPSGTATFGPASLDSVDDVRALGPDARAAVDAWLELHMWRTVTSDDVDRPTLAEVPALQLAALLGATEQLDVAEPDDASVRARVPAEHRSLFDELLAEARYGHRQREDIRGLCWNWPCGLVRRALLEAGRRLHAAGSVHEVGARRRAVPRRARPCAAR